jgi:formate/nitrite transporter
MLRLAILAICTSSVHGLIASHPSRFTTSPVFAVRASVPVAQAAPGLLALPPAGYEGAVAAGEKKANMAPDKIFALAMISGAHIGFGAWLMLAVGGACPGLAATNPGLQNIVKGAFGLPFGLMMTLVTGAELFTGNTALVTAALIEKKASLKQLIKSWTVSYSGNLVGSILLAAMVATGGTLGPLGGASVGTAVAKTSMAFKTAFFRGILCNWLVCMAVYMASFAKDLPGKMVAIWFPISAFIALGLEHSVANMFIIPLGIMSGAAVSWNTFFLKNLLPVTLGNIVGGAVFVASAFSYTYGALGKD